MFFRSRAIGKLLLCVMYWGWSHPHTHQVWASDLPVITARPEVEAQGSKVFLSEIVRVRPINATVTETLNATLLGLAPQPGKNKILSRAEILRALEPLGITPDRYVMNLPEEIKLFRRAQTISATQLQAVLELEFLPTLPWKDVQVEKLDLMENIQLPMGTTSFKFEYSPRTDLARPFYLTVSFLVDGEVVKRSFVRTTLDIKETAAVAAKELTSAQLVSKEDVRWEKQRLSSTLHPPILSEDFFESKKPRTSIAAGRLLTEDLFVSVPLVKRGETITLVYQDEMMRLTTLGKSMRSGMRGERIQVMNLDSRKTLMAEVVDQSTAKVVF